MERELEQLRMENAKLAKQKIMSQGDRGEVEQHKLRADSFEWKLKKARGLLMQVMFRQRHIQQVAKSFYQMRGQVFGTNTPDNDSRSENKAALYEQLT